MLRGEKSAWSGKDAPRLHGRVNVYESACQMKSYGTVDEETGLGLWRSGRAQRVRTHPVFDLYTFDVEFKTKLAWRGAMEVIFTNVFVADAINEWKNSKKFMHRKRSYVLGQLNEIEEDLLELDVACVPRDSNRLAIYLAKDGAETRRNLVNIDGLFGRVHELWCYDMGFEPAGQRLSEVDEEDPNMEEDGEVIQNMPMEVKMVD
ncbi:hypothetical protein AgCh_030565 [Apium graveolens]